jgi:hypothetical protein
MLEAFGARGIAAVLTGGEQHDGAKGLAFQAAAFDEPAVPAEKEAELLEDGDAAEEGPQA